MFTDPGRNYPEGAIRRELGAVDVEVVLGPSKGVSTSLLGRLGKFNFYRYPRFWMVEGPVPLAVASEIDSSPLGHQFIRPCGTTTKIPLVQLVRRLGSGILAIPNYSIDNADALEYFVDILRKHDLHK